MDNLENCIQKSANRLIKDNKNNHWIYQLECDISTTTEYIFLMYYLGNINYSLQRKMCNYLLRNQNRDGSWSLYDGSDGDISLTVRAYFALKLSGEPQQRTAKWIKANGGLGACNVFTKTLLAIFGQISWDEVPSIPPELVMSSYFLNNVAYWTKVVTIPMSIVSSLKLSPKTPIKIKLTELVVPQPRKRQNMFLLFDKFLKFIEPLLSKSFIRKYYIKKSFDYMKKYDNGIHGMGAISPAMFYSLLAYDSSDNGIGFRNEKIALDNLIVRRDTYAYLQPCNSPIWDTALSLHSLMEYDSHKLYEVDISKSVEWLVGKQCENGGWAFQYCNKHFPDVDDTGLIGALLLNYDSSKYIKNIQAAKEWLISIQSNNGGWGAFDSNNDKEFFNNIPFADHGAMIDPPTVDVTARVIKFLYLYREYYTGSNHDFELMDSIYTGTKFMVANQMNDGMWHGRWGTNYLWGTWSVISALSLILPHSHPSLQKTIPTIKKLINDDGGYGESNKSYDSNKLEVSESTPFHTALAIMILIMLDEHESDECTRAVKYLIDNQLDIGHWKTVGHNAPGFPKVFYLKYHGYSKYFPLWALSLYNNKVNGG